jgi:dynein heavy chain
LIDAHLDAIHEEVEEICDGADKQLQIELKLASITDQWQESIFEFMPWKNKNIDILKGVSIVMEELDESQIQLQSLLTMRNVKPFKDQVQRKLSELSDANETLELWGKVQMLWTSLESVFSGGDIARQMPVEAKKFVKTNKEWEKLMQRAYQTKNILQCCSNELLKNALPSIFIELEKC